MMDKDRINYIIRTRIIVYRKKMGLTQNQMADAIGMKRSTYSYYETKATKYTPDFLRSVAKVLGISPNVFDVNAIADSEQIAIPVLENEFSTPLEPFTATGNEQKLIKLYRMLSTEEKHKIFNSVVEALKENEEND